MGESSYPTEKISENARAFRQLGLGYANLGALLMAGPRLRLEPGAPGRRDHRADDGQGYRTSAVSRRRWGRSRGIRAQRRRELRVMRKEP